MNSVNLSGRASKEIELRYTPNGKAVSSGTIAVQRKFKNQQGEYEADFINFVCWGKGGELLAQYVKKGDFFGISGSIQTRNYEKDGRKIYVTEVNVSDFDFPVKPKQPQVSSNPATYDPNYQVQNNDPFTGGKPIDISDSDLPF